MKPEQKRDLSKIKCFKCGRLGHYANKCPLIKKSNDGANVTIESAHVAKEGEESCKVCIESFGNSSNFDSKNNFDFKILRTSCSRCCFGATKECLGVG